LSPAVNFVSIISLYRARIAEAGEETSRRAYSPQEKINMDFNRSNLGLVTPMLPPKQPVEEDAPAGSDWDLEKMTIGPAKPLRPAAPSPIPGVSPSDLSLSLAETLNWKVE